MRTERTRAVLLLGLLIGSRPASGSAPEKLPDCGSNPACRSLFEQARQQSMNGDLPEAQRLYGLAYEVCADPALLYSIARVMHKQGQAPAAAVYYRQFLQSPLDDAEQKRKAAEYLEQLGPAALQTPSSPPPGSRFPLLTGSPDLQASAGPPGGSPEARPIYRKWSFAETAPSDGDRCWNGPDGRRRHGPDR